MNQAVKIELESGDPAEIAIGGNESAPLPDANLALLLELERGRVKGMVQAGKLADVVISDQNEKIAELSAELELNSRAASTLRGEVASLTMELTTAKAKLAGQERLLARLGGAATEATSAALQTKQQALDMLGQQVVDLQERVVELEGALAAAQAQVKATGDAAGRAADANARLKHSEEQREALAAEGIRLLRDCKALRDDLDKALSENEALTQELQQSRAALSRADVAKKNALDAQAAQFEEIRRQEQAEQAKGSAGMVLISPAELELLRSRSNEWEALTSSNGSLKAAAENATAIANSCRERLHTVEADLSRSAELVKRQGERIAEQQLEVLAHRYMVHAVFIAPIYQSRSGTLRLMSADPASIHPGLEGATKPGRPICIWISRRGMSSLVWLAAEPDANGNTKLSFPAVPNSEQEAVLVDSCLPPEDEREAIANAIEAVDSVAMRNAFDEAAATAEVLAALHSPEAAQKVEEKLNRFRLEEARKAMVASVARRHGNNNKKKNKGRK
ncbi:MAG: hypothetical protein ACRDC7_00540 [Aeromonas veronii]